MRGNTKVNGMHIVQYKEKPMLVSIYRGHRTAAGHYTPSMASKTRLNRVLRKIPVERTFIGESHLAVDYILPSQ